MIEVWTKWIKKQRRILGNRKVSLGRMNKGTEVWKSSFAVPLPQVIEYDKGVGEGGDINGVEITHAIEDHAMDFEFFYRIMVSVF